MRMDHRDGPRTPWKLNGGWLPLASTVRVQVTLGTQGPNQDPWYPGVRLYQEGHTKSYNFSRVKDVHRIVYACVLSHSVVSNSLWPMDCSCQAAISKGFSRRESWSGLPFPFPGNLPDPGIKPGSPALQAYSFCLSHQGSPYRIVKAKEKVKSLSRVQFFAILGTAAYQAPPSMGFSRQEYWSGVPFPSPGDLPNPGIKPRFPELQTDALPSEPPGKPIHTG